MSILGDIGLKVGQELKALSDRIAVLEDQVEAGFGTNGYVSTEDNNFLTTEAGDNLVQELFTGTILLLTESGDFLTAEAGGSIIYD